MLNLRAIYTLWLGGLLINGRKSKEIARRIYLVARRTVVVVVAAAAAVFVAAAATVGTFLPLLCCCPAHIFTRLLLVDQTY